MNSLSEWLLQDSPPVIGFSSRKLSNMCELLHVLTRLGNIDDSPSPRIVLVGAQSSGKSSLINNLIGFPLLPTGAEMCTILPLNLCLSSSDTEVGVTIEAHTDSGEREQWEAASPNTTIIGEVNTFIQNVTEKMKGQSDVIHLKVSYPKGPNITIVDLPGLTVAQRTDHTSLSPDNLLNMATQYTSPENTIIIGVVAARPDVEVDLVWKVLQKSDPSGKRTAIVLTKPDLAPCTMKDRLPNLLSGIDTQGINAGLGYMTVMLKLTREYSSEDCFFRMDPRYTNTYSTKPSKFGMNNFQEMMATISAGILKRELPTIMERVQQRYNDTLNKIQSEFGEIETLKQNTIVEPQHVLTSCSRDFTNKVNISLRGYDDSSVVGGGGELFRIISEFRDNLLKSTDLLDAYSNYIDEHQDIGIRGIHIYDISVVAILESVVQNPVTEFSEWGPMSHAVIELFNPAVAEIEQLLLKISMNILRKCKILKHRGGMLHFIQQNIVTPCITKSTEGCKKDVFHFLAAEQDMVWCGDPEIKQHVSGRDTKGVVEIYQKNSLEHISQTVIKLCVYNFTTVFNKLLLEGMDTILPTIDQSKLSELIQEDSDSQEKRKTLMVSLELCKEALDIGRGIIEED